MPHPCEFHPNQSNERCGRPSSRKVRLTTEDPSDEHYLWVCDDCMAEAETWWKQGWNYEF
jgi:hypothetical protein